MPRDRERDGLRPVCFEHRAPSPLPPAQIYNEEVRDLVQEANTALAYNVAVGREGHDFSGKAVIGRKAEWPTWTPTSSMIRDRPKVNTPLATGLFGSEVNPLGARALYLYKDGADTLYRIHGTNDPSSIGKSVSSGCIRLLNSDVIDLYDRVGIGAHVVVR